MKIKTMVNGKGEPQASRIEIAIQGSGGELGMQAVRNLIALIDGIKDMETEEDVIKHYYIISGFAICCNQCGFLSEKSTDDLMHMVEGLVDNELVRVAEETGKDTQL